MARRDINAFMYTLVTGERVHAYAKTGGHPSALHRPAGGRDRLVIRSGGRFRIRPVRRGARLNSDLDLDVISRGVERLLARR